MALNQVGLERLNTATTKKIGTNKNLVINGAMLVAQRGTSSTSSGIHTVDRFTCEFSGTDASPTQEHETVAAGTEPYTSGFRNSFKVVNGNQSGGAGASDFINIQTKLEAQDIANSGWNYTSSSSYVTLSFWIKSSVAQTFKGFLRTRDGTEQRYTFDTGSLSADTWTKITKTIPGNSNITINNDNGEGLQINIGAFWGGTYTDNSVTEDAWGAYSGSTRMKDNTSTWYTTNSATLEVTGVQLEVGSVATDFEHRSYCDEINKCKRYYTFFPAGYIGGGRGGSGGSLLLYNYYLTTPMRAAPTFEPSSGWSSSNGIRAYKYNGQSDSTSTPILATNGFIANTNILYMSMAGHSIDDDRVASFTHNNTLGINAEL